MDLFDFIERFPGENDCIEYFILFRKKAGIACQICGCKTHSSLDNTDLFECKKCSNRISIKSGTVMENSRLSIKYWFIAIHLLTSTTEKYTISEIQEKLSGVEPEQVHEMLEKLNGCLSKLETGKSFDQLLLTCVANHNHHPATAVANQSKLLKRNLSTIQPFSRKQIKTKP